MKLKSFIKKSTALIAAACMITTIPVMAKTGYSSEDYTGRATGEPDYNAVIEDSLAADDIIDYSKKGKITIHKYDMTAASEIGSLEEIDTETTAFSGGEQNTEAETQFEKYAIKGVTFKYLRLGQIETSSRRSGSENQIQLVYELPDDFATLLGLTDDKVVDMQATDEANPCTQTGVKHFIAADVQEALKTTLAGGVTKKNDIEDYITTAGTEMTATDADGVTTAENLELGLYLFVETKVPEQVTSTVDPWIMSIPMTSNNGDKWLYDVHAYPKNQTGNPTLEKLVRSAPGKISGSGEDNSYVFAATGNTAIHSDYLNDPATNSNSVLQYINDREEYTYSSSATATSDEVVDYIILSKIPHITTKATYLTEYKFKDTLSAGLEYKMLNLTKPKFTVAFYESNPETWASDVKAHEPGSAVDGIPTYDADVDGKDSEYASVDDISKAAAVWDFTTDLSAQIKYPNVQATVTKDNNDKTKPSSVEFVVTRDGLNEINTKYSDYYMVIHYQARLNYDDSLVLGKNGNPNDVTLTWERTSDGYYDTLEDEAIVFSYGITVNKTFSGGTGDFSKIQFNLYNKTDGYYLGQPQRTETAADGTKIYSGWTEETRVGRDGSKRDYPSEGYPSDVRERCRFTVGTNGKIIFRGLEGDEYQLIEVKTDDKFSLLKDPIVIDIKPNTQDIESAVAGWDGMDIAEADLKNSSVTAEGGRPGGKIEMQKGEVTQASATVDGKNAGLAADNGSEQALVGVGVVNSKNWILPKTGGIGFTILPVIGVLIGVCGIIIALRSRKNEEC